ATFYVKVSQAVIGTYRVEFYKDKDCTNVLNFDNYTAPGATVNTAKTSIDIAVDTEKAQGLIGGYCNVVKNTTVDTDIKFFGIKEAAEVVEE
ncbi:MAG: hypothetical protein ACFNX0_04020, partial [Treponema sp.]